VRDLTCRQLVARLADDLDASLDARTRAEIAAHLRECAPCRAYLRTYRRTVGVVARAGRVRMPPAMRRRLLAALVARCATRTSSGRRRGR
jgi:predicted anti-sigma-YlaC factor YlaD